MSQEERLINGELLRLRREAQGWVMTDMALRACLSVKQVRQLEEGGTSAFYSASVKITAAKKVGNLLGLSVDEVFVSSVTPVVVPAVSVEEPHAVEVAATTAHTEAEPKIEHVTETVLAPNSIPKTSAPAVSEEAKPKTSLWAIVGLFAAALAIAAYMQPKEVAPVEAAPPLQVVPSEADAPASAADAPASSASATSDAVAFTAQKAASTTAMPASVATLAASTARAPGVVASAAAHAASKAP